MTTRHAGDDRDGELERLRARVAQLEAELRVQQSLFSPIISENLSVANASRSQLDDNLRRQLAEIAALYESAPIGIALVDTDLRFISINDKLARLSSMTVEDHVGKTFHQVLPLIASEVEPQLRQVLETGEAIFDSEVSGPLYAGGDPNIVRSRTFYPVKDSSGKLLGVTVVVQDITHQKRAAEALHRSEQELRQRLAELETIYRTAPIGLAYVDTELKYRAISDQLAKINGSSVQAHLGQTMTAIMPHLATTEMPLMQSVLDTGRPIIDQEVSAVTPGYPEGTRDYRRSLIPVRDEHGRLLGLNIVVQDITAQKRIAAAQRVYDQAMRSAVGSIILGDLNGIITYVNPATESVLGWPAEEMIGTGGSQCTMEPEKIAVLAQGLAARGYWEGEFRSRKKNGEVIHLLVHATVVKDANGQPISTMSWCIDISRQKQAESEREALIQQLEAKNAELEQFTYTVSHDLKSPLVTISGFVGLLEQDLAANNAAAVREDLHEITTAATRMQRLLDELLQLSRIGRVINPPQDVSISAIVRQILQSQGAAIASNRIVVDLAETLPVVRGDGPRLFEVFQNLIDNAVKFCRQSPAPRIAIGYRQASDGPVIYIRDNGIGIETRYLQRIFGLFEQLDPGEGGTGIGLAIAKRVVEVHGGTIWAESEGIGKGATFCLTLPGIAEP